MKKAINTAAAITVAASLAAMPNFNASAQNKGVIPPLPKDMVLRMDGDVPILSRNGHQLVYIRVMDNTLSNFRISYFVSGNGGINENAPSFAIYSQEMAPARFRNEVPDRCAGFLGVKFPYTKLSDTEAVIDFTDWQVVPDAMNKYGCVIISNQRQLGNPPRPRF